MTASLLPRDGNPAWIAAVVLAGGSYAAYAWSQQQYYLSVQGDVVTVFRGVDQTLGPVSLSTVYEDTNIVLADLSDFDRQTVEATISARSLSDAELIVDRLRPTEEAGG